ncbi:MAG: peptidylprolyl isomerase [Terriglobales bacterium]
MRKLLLASTAVLILAAVAFAADTVVEEIVARVNNSIITRNDLQKAKEQMITEAREKGENADDLVAKHQADMLRDLIDQQLLIQKAADLGITGDTELIKKLDDMRKQMGLNSMEELEKAAEQQGISYEDFKQNLRNNIITQAVIGREVGSHIQFMKEETQKFYDEHKGELERPEQVVLSEILIAPTKPGKEGEKAPDPTAEQLAAAEKKAGDVLAELKNGAKFDEVAKKQSDGPTAAQGGQLGAFGRGTLAKELEDKTFALKTGEYTDVIRTKQGFVILKVDQHTPAGVPPLKDVEQNIQEAIYLQKLQPALRAYLTKLREDAYIDIKEGYTDSAASPNETKPVYMAADAPTEGKAAKKKKKFLIF